MDKSITAISLQSGSNGNCIYVEAGGVKLLFDAGISGAKARNRLRAFGRDIRDVDAVIMSHDHTDHVLCAGVYHRMFGLPLWITRKTFKAARMRMGHIERVHYFVSGRTLQFGEVSVETIRTPHDGVDGVAFVVTFGQKRLGILTDLGHVFAGLREIAASLDAALIESNYDPDMLLNGPYPQFLKNRILGPHGHISNLEAAELLRNCAGRRMKWVCLAHLSETNNDPNLAKGTHRRMWGRRFRVHVASRYGPSEIMRL